MLVATIVEDARGVLHIRLGKSPQTGGAVKVVDTLNGTDLKELKDRAERYVADLMKKRAAQDR